MLPEEVSKNDQFTKLVCKVIADNSFNYSMEFRGTLLKKLILPKDVFLYQKFTKLICKVAVTPMSQSFIKMKCKRAVLKKKGKNEVPKKNRKRPAKIQKKLFNFLKNKKISNELKILTANEINESYLKPKIDPNFFNCKVRLNCILRNSIKKELNADSSSLIYAASSSSKHSFTTIFNWDDKSNIKMEC